MAAGLYNQYAWLVDTIRTAGRITKHEIDERWSRSTLNEKGDKVYPLRSFHRHKEAIAELFGLYIGCDKLDGNRYYLSDKVENMSGDFRISLCNTLTFANIFLESSDMQRRVVWEPLNDGSRHLATLLDAMRQKKCVALRFVKERGGREIIVTPYCLGQHKRIWYLAAKDDKSEQEVDVIALNSVDTIKVLSVKGVMPKWFKGDIFFASFFDKTSPKERVKKEKSVEPAPKPAKAAKKQSQEEADKASNQLSLF